MKRRPLAERFWEKVNRRGPIPEARPELGPCWLWTAQLNQHGYGVITIDNRPARAHRVAYELEVAPISADHELDHLCRVPACVNPAHLEPVTHEENCRRGLRGELTTHCPAGHPYDEKNTYWRPKAKGRGRRVCRACRAIAQKARYLARTGGGPTGGIGQEVRPVPQPAAYRSVSPVEPPADPRVCTCGHPDTAHSPDREDSTVTWCRTPGCSCAYVEHSARAMS